MRGRWCCCCPESPGEARARLVESDHGVSLSSADVTAAPQGEPGILVARAPSSPPAADTERAHDGAAAAGAEELGPRRRAGASVGGRHPSSLPPPPRPPLREASSASAAGSGAEEPELKGQASGPSEDGTPPSDTDDAQMERGDSEQEEDAPDLLSLTQFVIDVPHVAAESRSASSARELCLAVVSAVALGEPEYRLGATSRTYVGRGQLNAYVEVGLGKSTQKTGVGSARGRDVDFSGEEMIFSVSGETSIAVKVFDKRNWSAMVRGDPMIGEGSLQILANLPDGKHRTDTVEVIRGGKPMGSLQLRYTMRARELSSGSRQG